VTVETSDRCSDFVLKRVDDADGALGDIDAVVGEAQLHRACIRRVFWPLQQTAALEGARELRDEDGLEASPVGQLALTGLGATARKPVQRREQGVLGVCQAKRLQGAVHRHAEPGGQTPNEIANGGMRGRLRHAN
jgi:hypothetical protein